MRNVVLHKTDDDERFSSISNRRVIVDQDKCHGHTVGAKEPVISRASSSTVQAAASANVSRRVPKKKRNGRTINNNSTGAYTRDRTVEIINRSNDSSAAANDLLEDDVEGYTVLASDEDCDAESSNVAAGLGGNNNSPQFAQETLTPSLQSSFCGRRPGMGRGVCLDQTLYYRVDDSVAVRTQDIVNGDHGAACSDWFPQQAAMPTNDGVGVAAVIIGKRGIGRGGGFFPISDSPPSIGSGSEKIAFRSDGFADNSLNGFASHLGDTGPILPARRTVLTNSREASNSSHFEPSWSPRMEAGGEQNEPGQDVAGASTSTREKHIAPPVPTRTVALTAESDFNWRTKQRQVDSWPVVSEWSNDAALKLKEDAWLECNQTSVSRKNQSSKSRALPVDATNKFASNDSPGCCSPDERIASPRKPLAMSEKHERLDRLHRMAQDADVSEIKFVDCHAHIDFIFSKLRWKKSWNKFKSHYASTFPKNYEMVIADFCRPSSFLKAGDQVNLLHHLLEENQSDVRLAFGCHPHFADEYDEFRDDLLDLVLSEPRCIAVGEMGLDYSGNNSTDHELQAMVFEAQLRVAMAADKPVVLHVRDADDDALTILQKVLPSHYRIHRHCFLRSFADAWKWKRAFPNLYFGLTPIVLYNPPSIMDDFLKRFPLDRIILETDAPYFLSSTWFEGMHTSHPGMASLSAAALAEIRQLPFSSVLSQMRKNTSDLYGI